MHLVPKLGTSRTSFAPAFYSLLILESSVYIKKVASKNEGRTQDTRYSYFKSLKMKGIDRTNKIKMQLTLSHNNAKFPPNK